MTMDIKLFTNNLSKYAGYYNPAGLFSRIKEVSKKVGVNVIYIVMILYYATFDKGLPIKDRLMVIAALGYFILPLDILPDGLPGGFADDAAALAYVVRHIWNNLSEDTIQKARQRVKVWFPDTDVDNISPF